MTSALAIVRLLPMSARAEDTEILALRHQTMVLERQLHDQRIHPADRAFLRCCTGFPAICYTAYGYWCDPRPCCAGTGICSRAIARAAIVAQGQADGGGQKPGLGLTATRTEIIVLCV